MSLLIFALVVLLVVGLCIYGLQTFSPDAKLTQIGSFVLILIGVLVIINRMGVL